MTLYQIWDLASYIAGKFPSGGSVPPARLNLLLPQVSEEWYQALLKKVIAASVNDMLLDKVLSTTPLRVFKKANELTEGDSGVYPLPIDYNRYIVARTKYKQVSTGTSSSLVTDIRRINIVSDEQYASKQGDIFTRAEVQPFAKITGTNINVVPYGLSKITLDYFRPPAVPVFDWCQSTASPNLIIYMPVGSRVYLDDALSPNLYDSNDALIATGVTKSGTYPIVSRTVELEWESQYHFKFVYMILSKIGLNLSEMDVAKYALEMEQK